jgi:hypothetical protein
MANGDDRLQQLFSEAGIPWGAFTPEEQFRAYSAEQFRPGPSPLRSGFWGARDPLMQQWYLAQPKMPTYGGFGEFMSGFAPTGTPGAAQYDPYYDVDLRTLARQVAGIAGMPSGQFFQYVDPQADYAGPAISEDLRSRIGELTPAQQLLYRHRYGTGEDAGESQRQLATLMALQRQKADNGAGGGLHGGIVGAAITSALREMQDQLYARDPGRNFLDWYLERTQPGEGGVSQGIGRFLTPAPVEQRPEATRDMQPPPTDASVTADDIFSTVGDIFSPDPSDTLPPSPYPPFPGNIFSDYAPSTLPADDGFYTMFPVSDPAPTTLPTYPSFTADISSDMPSATLPVPLYPSVTEGIYSPSPDAFQPPYTSPTASSIYSPDVFQPTTNSVQPPNSYWDPNMLRLGANGAQGRGGWRLHTGAGWI